MWQQILEWGAIIFAAVSGGCWMEAAAISTPLPMAWLSGPPKEVVDRIERQSRWNGIAAYFAAAAAFAQAMASLTSKLAN